MTRLRTGRPSTGVLRLPFWARLLLIATFLMSPFAVLPSAVTPALAQGTPCVNNGPAGGSYVARVCITAPVDGATVSGEVTTTVTVSSASGQIPGVKTVRLYLNRTASTANASLAAEYQSPYSIRIPTARWIDDQYRLEANVLFADGYTTTVKARIILTFANGVSTAPSSGGSWTPKTSGSSPLDIVAVGDGAGGLTGATQVGNLATAQNPDLFLYLGDVYNSGTYTEFYNYYEPTLGALKSRTNPVPGNHETGNGFRGYMDYWDSDLHYYSYDSGGWHFIALDSTDDYGQTAPGSPQYTWLANDLAANANTACTVVYFHHPRFGLAGDRGAAYMQDIWSLLYNQGVDVVLNGHEHNYQRWRPMDGQGGLASNGITQYIIGTGGHELLGFGSDSRVAYKLKDTDGVLSLTLGATGGSSRFITTGGSTVDQNSFNCHPGPRTGNPDPDPTVTVTPGGTSPLTLGPVDDAMVNEANATTNYGTSLSLRADTSPTNEISFLRFDVQGLTSPAVKATLRLYVRDGTGNAPYVARSTETSWSESGITWSNKPSTGAAIDDLGLVSTGTWIEYDVTSQVTANGLITFALVPQATDALSVNSKENSTNKPQLIIQRSGSTTPTVTPTVTTTPVTSVPFTSAADARVEERNPTNNYGIDDILQADGGADPDVETYLRFTVSGLTGAPVSAKVRLYVPTTSQHSGSVNGPALYLSSSNIWSEMGITWENRPPRTSTMFEDKAAVNSGTWVEYDVTSAITGNGEYSFVLATSSSDATDFWSKETVNKPQLVITMASSGTPTTTPSATPSATPGTPAATPSATVTATAPPSGPQSLLPVADSMVREANPTTNYGRQGSLRSDGSPPETSYLLFDVQGLSGPATSATLRLWVRDGTKNAPGIAGSTDTSWTETGINWTNKPGAGPIVSDLGEVSTGTWIEYDVTSLITGNGPVTLVIVAQSGDALSVNSRESDTGQPQLVIGQSGTSRTAATPTASATATATATSTAEASPSPTEPTETTSLGPVADARVSLNSPTSNYGSSQTLLADTSPQEASYLRFEVPETSGTITSATLRLWVVDSSSNAPALATSPDTSWDESAITWDTKPTVGATVADLGSIKAGTWVEYDVSSAVTGPGLLTFVFVAQSSNGSDFASRESAMPPELIINGNGGAAQSQIQASSAEIESRSVAAPTESETAATPEPSPTATPAATPTLEPTVTATTEDATVVTGTVTNTGGSNLRCRTTPSLDGEVIAQLPEGTQVIVRGPQEGDWLPIVCEDQDGYAAAEFIVIGSTDAASATPTAIATADAQPTPSSDGAAVSPTIEVSPTEQTVAEPTPTEATVEPTPLPIQNGWQDDPAVPWWLTTDEDLGTTWSGYAEDTVDEVELGYDLGDIVPISHLRWQPTWPLQGSMEIQLSNDGINWYRLRTVDLTQLLPDEWAEIPVHTQARYINLVFTNPFGAGNVGAIREMEVWAETSGTAQVLETLPLIVPTPVPVPTEPPPTEAPPVVPTAVPAEPTAVPTEIPVVDPTVPPPPAPALEEAPAEPAQEAPPDGT